MSASARPRRAALDIIVAPALAGTGVFAGAFLMAIYQLARSNRPHELTLAPVVTLIQAGAVALIGLGALRLMRALRGRREAPVSAWHWVLAALVPLMAAASVVFLVVSAATAIEVLRS